MSMRNIVHVVVPCPVCSRPYELGFTIDEGAQVGEVVCIGEKMMWESSNEPISLWETQGVGQCGHCQAWLSATIRFDALKFIGADNVRAQSRHNVGS